jgi:hypothetical protein
VQERWAFVTSKALHKAYEDWALDMGERPMSQKKLGVELKTRGFQSVKDAKDRRGWLDLRLKSVDNPDPSTDVSRDEKPCKTPENAESEPPYSDTSGSECGNSPLETPRVEKFPQNDLNVSIRRDKGVPEFSGTFAGSDEEADELMKRLGV